MLIAGKNPYVLGTVAKNKKPSPYGLGFLPLMEQTSEINQRRNHHAQPTVCENQYSRKAVTRSCQIAVTLT
jgi:hypothetical protein